MKRKLRMGMAGGGHDAFIGAIHRIAAAILDTYFVNAGYRLKTNTNQKQIT